MKHRKSKFISMLLIISLVISQFISILNIDNVFAEENNNDYSNIVPGKILVKYKNTEGQENLNNRFFSALSKSSSENEIKEITLNEGADIFQTINEIKSDSNVEYAEPIYIRHVLETSNDLEDKKISPQSVNNPNDSYYQWGEQIGLEEVNIKNAWEKVSYDERSKITIAIIDTCIDLDHPDLQQNIIDGYDFINDKAINSEYVQVIDASHGTHVAGIAAAISDNVEGIAGIAGGAKIMPLRVINSEGATSQDIGDAIKWAADKGADVINMSLGGPGFSQYEYDAVKYAYDKGVVIVAATGNESNHWIEYETGDTDGVTKQERGTQPVSYPAAYSGVIGVGAVTTYNTAVPIIADFSNIGTGVDVVAPGVGIYSAVPTDTYTSMSGTSMSTPFVSGLAALILASNDNLSPEQVEDIIIESAVDIVEPLGQDGWDEYYGYGLIDGYGAFNMPRLEMELTGDDLLDAEQDTPISLLTKDYQGTIISSVYGQAEVSIDKYDFDASIWTSVESLNTVIDIVYGQGNGVVNLPDIGFYRILADDNDKNEWIWSRFGYVARLPEAPTATPQAGIYTEEQTIVLSTNTAGAKIYYTLDGTDPVPTSAIYNGSIKITSSKTVKALAVKDSLASDISTFSYTINSSDEGSSGGSSGGGGPSGGGGDDAPIPVAEEVIISNEIPEEKIEIIEKTKDAIVTIEIETSDSEEDKFEIDLSGDILNTALENNNTISLKSDKVLIDIEPGTLGIDDGEATVQLTTKELDSKEVEEELNNKEAFANEVSNVFEFDLAIDDEKVDKFNKSMKITLKFDKNKVKDVNKLGVYYYNEEKELWEYVGGKVNEDLTITFETEHFSKYTVMEYTKTFTDIDNHWAKYDIEVMASRHIANGVTDDNFVPNRNITRAEFASLLARAIDLPQADIENKFIDVADTWYKESVIKAYNANIINGIEDTKFAPEENITREQMATMLMRAYSYATGKKLEDIITTAEVKFKDEGAVSSWARRNVRLVESIELMNGKENSKFEPRDNATRAEAIVVIKRLMDKLDI